MTDTSHIRLRKDGSIDTAYWRSQAAHDAARNVTKGSCRAVSRLAIFVAMLPLLGRWT
ncbi:hypothetical protein [Tritonibacter mobilis]|uniref:hypothetical protein n=1 Tax=Tritonibacter mobilis TaxID=379347 RepID=UPI003A5C4FB8